MAIKWVSAGLSAGRQAEEAQAATRCRRRPVPLWLPTGTLPACRAACGLGQTGQQWRTSSGAKKVLGALLLGLAIAALPPGVEYAIAALLPGGEYATAELALLGKPVL